MFEVGKKYVAKTISIKFASVRECMYVGPEFSILRSDDNEDILVDHDKAEYYKEYKEPVTLIRYVPVLKHNDGSVILGSINYIQVYLGYTPPNGVKLIDWVEVKYEVKDD